MQKYGKTAVFPGGYGRIGEMAMAMAMGSYVLVIFH